MDPGLDSVCTDDEAAAAARLLAEGVLGNRPDLDQR